MESLTGQQPDYYFKTNHSALMSFAGQKNEMSGTEKRKADSVATLLCLPLFYVENSGRVVTLQRLGRNNSPVYYATDNATAAAIISADLLWSDNNSYPSLSGEGVEINLWDGGAVLTTHREFQDEYGSRITLRDIEATLSAHATHIAGTMIAAGIDQNAHGMAYNAVVKSWDYNDDLSEMASSAADGIILSNHSYGPLCGWYYNTLNESWYWYGDPEISENEDYKFGFYDQVSADLDFIASNAPYYLIVKSAGNDRNDYPSESFIHYVWDGTWKTVNTERDPDGGADGYDCLNPMAVAKNILTVGAIDDEGNMTDFSSFGPTDDGRIKPDIVANGYSVYSSVSSSTNSYDTYNGTSMATASVTGSVALLRQLQHILTPGASFISSTVKALLIHTATEAGINPGPDYSYGWGLINIKEATDLISQNCANGGKNIYEGIISEGETVTITVETALSPYLKVTVCWTDPAGEPSLVTLNPRESRLVNDIDVKVENSVSHQAYLPWILDVENPSAAATIGINHTDNVEQIVIADPGENSFNIAISHTGSLTGGQQSFSLIVSGIATPSGLFPAQNLTYNITLPGILLKWNAPASGSPASYKVYRNGEIYAETADTSFTDETIITDNIYEYYVTAVYELNNDAVESVGTNRITVHPQSLRPLPFSVDFEVEPEDITIKDNETGWLWGTSESLSCYYLDFSANTTNFIGADSYSAGDAVHIWDIAATAPLRLGEYENIALSFDYLLKNGIYGAIDEMHIVYKLQEETEWHELVSLESSFQWKHQSVELPAEIYKNGTQIGFYYDDMYQWGMGAGLDNILITGTPVRSVDLSLNAMTSPVSSCVLTADEKVIVTIRNNSTQPALPGDIINVNMTLSTGKSITDVITLNDELAGGDILTWQMSSTADLSEQGDYTFDFTISSGFDFNDLNNQLSSSITVYGNPVALILNSGTSFCINDPPVQVMVSPSGGTLSGPGISGFYFSPSTAGAGYHTINYAFVDENGCSASASAVFTVNSLPQPQILNQDLSFCAGDQATEIIVNPEGGILSGPGVIDGFFHPEITGEGEYYITYEYTDNSGCTATASSLIVVNELPQPKILNADNTFCIDDPPVQVMVSPSGGTLSGTGISGLYFSPSTAGAGYHTIAYAFTDENGCSASASAFFTVNDLPQPQILNQDLSFCAGDQATEIIVNPEGGILSGPGVVDGFFRPSITGAGEYYISYGYTDASGCTALTSRTATVNENPVIYIGPDTTIATDETIRFGLPLNGLSFLWFDGSTDNYLTVVAENYGVGTYDVWVTGTDIYSCSTTDSLILTITLADFIDPENETDLLVYPNPARDGICLKIDEQETISEFLLYGYNGILLMNEIPSSFPCLDISGLKPGYYILKIRTESNVYYRVIIKV